MTGALDETALRNPQNWRVRGQRRLIDSITAVVLTATVVLMAWPGDDDPRLARVAGGYVVFAAVTMIWVQLRIFEDRKLAWLVGFLITVGLLVVMLAGGEAVQRIALSKVGVVRTATVAYVEKHSQRHRVSWSYGLVHSDGTPVCGTIDGWTGEPLEKGDPLTIVEDPGCVFGIEEPDGPGYALQLWLTAGGLLLFATSAYGGRRGYLRKCRA